jgi:hypothetical protein
MSSSEARLVVTIDGYAEIRVYDGNFRAVARGTGALDVPLPAGLYEIAYRAGWSETKELVALRAGETKHVRVEFHPRTVAPIPKSATSKAEHENALRSVINAAPPSQSGQGQLVVFSRVLPRDSHAPMACTFALVDQNYHFVPDVSAPMSDSDGWRAAVYNVPAGGYALRTDATFGDSRNDAPPEVVPVDQALWVCEDWQTLVCLTTSPSGFATGDTSIFMAREGQLVWPPHQTDLALALEVAVSGLASGRVLVPRDQLRRMLHEKFDNPMLGVVAAYCMLMTTAGTGAQSQQAFRPRLASADSAMFTTVVNNLKMLLGETPDVCALLLATGMDVPPCEWPPMLASGYNAMLTADARRGGNLVAPNSRAEELAAWLVGNGAWTRWHAEPARLLRGQRRRRSSTQTLVPTLESAVPSTVAEERLWSYVGQFIDLTEPNTAKVLWETLDPHAVSANTGLPFYTVVKGIDRLKKGT